MGVYSIKDLENFTNIKAHTLRIWEQRYNLLNPERTDTNIRFYSDSDLKKLLNVNLLYQNGLKISKIAKLTEKEIFRLANEILMEPEENDLSSIDHFINWIVDFNEAAILNELNNLCEKHDFDIVFTQLIIPVLKKVGELWQVDSITITHEHFFSHIIRDYIIKRTGLINEPKKPKARILLMLREDEYHELGLLFYNFYLRKLGYLTIYLGQAVPLSDLERIIDEIKPDYLFTSLIAKLEDAEFKGFFEQLGNCYNLKKVYCGGYQMNVFKDLTPKDVNVIHSIEDIDFV